jgi:hypothetical protein
MTGFEIYIDDQVIYASLDKGLLIAIFSHVKGGRVVDGTHFSVIGSKKRHSFERMRWFSEEINDVNKVVIKVVDMDKNSEFSIRPDDRNEMLKEYYSLKETLKDYL